MNSERKCMKEKVIRGFCLTGEDDLPELSAKLYTYEHIKSGASLIYIDRKDENKTFAIAFKTLPEDDTGVFHILEHSVLCGSKKFPVKEPFVELLKASLKTFLNAFTFPDKTMYPTSSRNEKDFLNLVDVYMDAVLHPLAIEKPEIFYQEGWHYDIEDENSPMTYKGVVFNEMKGAYSSVDELETAKTAKLLYRGSVYGYDSGGDPRYIPDLTYEKFCAAHSKYYHPSNSKIILDGEMDLDAVLALLDGYLCEYSRKEIDAPIGLIEPKGFAEETVYYEIGEQESEEGKARICLGFLAGDFSKRRERIALSAITDAIAGSNDSPFKKAILDTGMVEDLSFFGYDGIAHNSLFLEFKNLKQEDADKVLALSATLLKKFAKDGVDRKLLSSSLSAMEFRAREQDGYYPQGLSNAIAALDTWLYGGNPKDMLVFENDFAFLKDALSGDYYEKLIEEVLVNSKHSVKVTLLPSKTVGEERRREEEGRLAEELAKLSKEEIKEKIEAGKRLLLWQKTPDSKENLDTIPTLAISDLNPLPQERYYEKEKILEREAIFTPAASKGIYYCDILFDISDLDEKELFTLSLTCDLIKNVRTENYSAVDIQTEIKSHLGTLYFGLISMEKAGKVTPYIKAHFSCLEGEKQTAKNLLEELVFRSVFTGEEKVISDIIKQNKTNLKDSFSSSGNSIGIGRIGAYTSAEAAIGEYTDGVEFYFSLKKLADGGKEALTDFIATAERLMKTVFTRDRLILFYTGNKDRVFAEELISLFKPDGVKPGECKIKPLGIKKEAFSVPSRVAFATLGSNISYVIGSTETKGYMLTARSILSLDYLWNEIRVKGGAYGGGLTHRVTGSVVFYSYRDPSPARSIGIYRSAAEFLRNFAKEKRDLTGFIIGTIGDADTLITPKIAGTLTMRDYLRGESYEERAKRRKEILSTSHSDLEAAAEIIEKICDGAGVLIVAGADKISECRHLVDTVIEI